MSRIKEAIGYESAQPDPDVFGMAEQQIEQDQQAAEQQEPPAQLNEEDLALIPF